MINHGVSDYYGASEEGASGVGRAFSNKELDIAGDMKFYTLPSAVSSLLYGAAKYFTKSGKSVCFGYNGGRKDAVNLVDMEVPGTDKTFGEMCAEEYHGMSETEASYRYMHRIGGVYCEIPSKKYSDGVQVPSYTKFITTANIDVVTAWDESDSVKKSSYTKLETVDLDQVPPTLVNHQKLDLDRKTGLRKVINAQKPVDFGQSGLSVVPLIVQKGVVDTLYKNSLQGYIKVTYLKDAGEERSLYTTFNPSLISEVYGDDYDVEGVLADCYQGDFFSNSGISRGYIRVPSIGESKYSDITRSLNYNRIVSIEYNVEPEIGFVNLDINQVVPSFLSAIDKLDSIELSDMGVSLKESGLSQYSITGSPDSMEKFVERGLTFGGTSFKHSLAMFMLAYSAWFPNYSGEGTGSEGVVEDDMNIGLM